MNKVFKNALDAIYDIQDGASIMSSGFGLSGNPENLLAALHQKGVKDLTVISNNCGTDRYGLGILLNAHQIKKMIASYVGENKEFERQFLQGELEVELNPQGTLAERLRAGGAGIAAFFTPTGYGTAIADGGLPRLYDGKGGIARGSAKKETREFDGKMYVLERGLRADFAIVKAFRGDTHGNLVYRKTARNFAPMMCAAARVTIAEVEELVQPGELEPDQIHTPGIYVQRIFQGSGYEKWIEQRTTRPRA